LIVEQKLSARRAGILPAAAPKGNPAAVVGAFPIYCNLRVAASRSPRLPSPSGNNAIRSAQTSTTSVVCLLKTQLLWKSLQKVVERNAEHCSARFPAVHAEQCSALRPPMGFCRDSLSAFENPRRPSAESRGILAPSPRGRGQGWDRTSARV